MTEEIDGISTRELVRWAALVALLLACLGAYFVFAPSIVPPLAPPAAAP